VQTEAVKRRAECAVNPRRSLVRTDVMAEPLSTWRRQHAVGRSSTGAPPRITGVTGTARREGRTLNVGDLDWRDDGCNSGYKAAGPRSWGQRGVGWVRSTCEGDESRWREGALLDDATYAGKEGRLWQH
jgi:hypothetical protein